MSRGSIHPRTALQWLLAGFLLLLLAVLLGQLRRSAPYEAPEFVVEGAEDPSDPSSDVVTCERSLPDVSTVPEGARGPTPVGRVTSSQVVECPAVFDGRAVVYIGEVIGDVLRRDGGAWVLMNDDDYALEAGPLRSHGQLLGYNSGLSVWLEGDLAGLVDEAGGPDRRGDILLIRGVVNRTDPADGGGLTIRAFEGEVLVEGEPVRVPLHTAQALVAVVLALGAGGLLVIERRARRRR